MKRKRALPRVIYLDKFPVRFSYKRVVYESATERLYGQWIVDDGGFGGTAEICTKVKREDQVETVLHELDHAYIDFRAWLRDRLVGNR